MNDVQSFATNLRHRLGIGTQWRFVQVGPNSGILLVPVTCTEEEWIKKHSPELATEKTEDSHRGRTT